MAVEMRALCSSPPPIWRLRPPPPGRDRTVMLVPGLLANDDTMSCLRDWLRRGGFHVVESGIKRNVGCPDELIDVLVARLRERLRPGEKALLIGHSKGGLLSVGVAHRSPELVERVLALGSPLDDPFALHWNTRVTLRVLATAMRLRGRSRKGCYTPRCTCRAMGLVRQRPPLPVPATNVASRSDGIVLFESCLRPEVEVREVETAHTEMPWRPEVISVVAEWLRAEKEPRAA
jgi:pimeloyl-ACP methyl ester carboxylesterase